MIDENNLTDFATTFFKNLGATVLEEDNIFVISNVPKDFEDLAGRKSPYRFTINQKMADNAELLTNSSSLLKSMLSYLEGLGQATLVKLNFNRDYKFELEHYLSLKNSTVNFLKIKEDYESIARFTIATTLQYLNEKEQIVNHIFVKNNEIANFDLEKYEYSEGKKEEAPKIEIKEAYETAKRELKNLTKKRVDDTIKTVSEKLEKEISRVKNHYSKNKNEHLEIIKKQKEQLANLETQLARSKPEEKAHIETKIDRIKQSIVNTEKSDVIISLEKEEQFFISDEKNKHSLKINNKLINTTIVYYPIFNFEINLKSTDSSKTINISYDPLADEILKEAVCDCCNREIREIFVCLSGHCSCSNCKEECAVCNNVLCLACTKKRCDFCTKKLCKKCNIVCPSCSKHACKIHSNKDHSSQKYYCLNCLERCDDCGNLTAKVKKEKGNSLCESCLRKSKAHFTFNRDD